MAIPKRNIRSLQEIRTISGKVDGVFQPYRAYMRISCLEMEKFRRAKERESAMHRVKNIDARFKEIESEKDTLLQILGEQNSNGSHEKVPGIQPKPPPHRRTGGFKFRY